MKRLRIGLRLMLLLVALFAVFFAWIGALRELQRVNARGELERLQFARKSTLNHLSQPDLDTKARREMLAEIEAEIAKRRKLLGTTDH